MRRYRANVAAGRRIARAPYDDQTVAFMVAMKWLDPAHADDPAAIGLAFFRLIKDAAKNFP
jgi:hypothetical protein